MELDEGAFMVCVGISLTVESQTRANEYTCPCHPEAALKPAPQLFFLADGVELVHGHDEEGSVGEDGGGVDGVFHVVLGEDFHLGGGFENSQDAVLVAEIDLAVDDQGAAPDLGLAVVVPE